MSFLGAILSVIAGLAIMSFGLLLFTRGCRCFTACSVLISVFFSVDR